MPSGPKRRRSQSAKKVNKNIITTPIPHSPSPTIQLQGRHDLESYDNKERAGSEGVSLVSHSYCDQHILVEEEKEKERNISLSVASMEDSLNGKVEETQKVESLDEEGEVVVEEANEVDSERGIVIDGNSESVNGTHEGEQNEISPLVDSEKLEEEKEVIGSVVDSVEPVVSLTEELTDAVEAAVEKLKDSDVTEMESKDLEEKIMPSLDATDGVSPVVTDVGLNGIEETPPPSSDETNGFFTATTDVESSGTEETMPPSSDENKGLTPVVTDVVSKGIEETTLSSWDENGGVPPVVTDVVSEGIEETKLPALEENTGESSGITDLASSKETVDHSLMGSADSPAANIIDATEQGDKREIPESTPIVSLSRRTVQPTSWRNCCGLFEVLRRRSDR